MDIDKHQSNGNLDTMACPRVIVGCFSSNQQLGSYGNLNRSL